MAHRVATECLAGRIGQVARIVLGHFDRVLRPLGITANQITMLSAIEILRECTASDLDPILVMDRSTVSRNVERLAASGWITRRPGVDRRTVYLTLSPAGEEVLRRAEPLWEQAHAWALAQLEDDGAEAVYRMAKKFNPRLLR